MGKHGLNRQFLNIIKTEGFHSKYSRISQNEEIIIEKEQEEIPNNKNSHFTQEIGFNFSKNEMFELFYSKCIGRKYRRIQSKLGLEFLKSSPKSGNKIDNLQIILNRDDIEGKYWKKSAQLKERRCPRRKKANFLDIEIHQ